MQLGPRGCGLSEPQLIAISSSWAPKIILGKALALWSQLSLSLVGYLLALQPYISTQDSLGHLSSVHASSLSILSWFLGADPQCLLSLTLRTLLIHFLGFFRFQILTPLCFTLCMLLFEIHLLDCLITIIIFVFITLLTYCEFSSVFVNGHAIACLFTRAVPSNSSNASTRLQIGVE